MLTDILHAFAQNPTHPAYDPHWQWPHGKPRHSPEDGLVAGIHTIGHDGASFSFDNERPAHQVLLQPVRVARTLVTNGEWLEFMADGGYATPSLWLSDGWATVEAQAWNAPGYWQHIDGAWFSMTLGGLRAVDPSLPVCHVSYYEADAFARWAGKHLPSEAEWEVAARAEALDDAFGAVWQWTRSAYSPYPDYQPEPGALGEYNGKFMINQMVLRGSSLATPAGHSRKTYRNFFYPSARWQFSGLRLGGIRTLSPVMSPRSALRAPRPTETANEFAADVVTGLTAKPKYLPPKYFYDLTGSGLFDRITDLAGILSDAQRARPFEQACAGNRLAVSARLRAGRIRRRLEPQSAHPAARRGERRSLCSGRYLRRFSPRGRGAAAPRFSASVHHSGGGGLHRHGRIAWRDRRHAARRLLSRLDDRQFRAA